jgi:superoxide dismutase
MDYGTNAADYIGSFMAAINWSAVRRIYTGLRT